MTRSMPRLIVGILGVLIFGAIVTAKQAPAAGPYKVLQTAKVGGEGGTDYIFADSVGRRLYITRNAGVPCRPPTHGRPWPPWTGA